MFETTLPAAFEVKVAAAKSGVQFGKTVFAKTRHDSFE
jgi:hypothetical protein